LILLLILFIATGIAYAISFNRIIYPIKTKDASGDILEQKQPPARIISIDPAVTEILFNLNLKDRIVGLTENCNYPEDAKNIAKVGKDRIDLKKVVELKPDLIIVNLDSQRSDMEKLRLIMMPPASEEAQLSIINVFAVDPHTLKDIYNTISAIGTITNKEHAAYSLLQRMKRRAEWVEARAKKEKRLKAVVVIKKRPLTVAAEGTYFHDLLRVCGLIDVSPQGKGMYPRMKRDEISKADPDVIITSTDVAKNPRDIYNSRDFRKTSAGKNRKAVSIDAEVFLRPGPRVVEALEEIAAFTYGWPR
jgi:iron complex transport system substrate-binding protein